MTSEKISPLCERMLEDRSTKIGNGRSPTRLMICEANKQDLDRPRRAILVMLSLKVFRPDLDLW